MAVAQAVDQVIFLSEGCKFDILTAPVYMPNGQNTNPELLSDASLGISMIDRKSACVRHIMYFKCSDRVPFIYRVFKRHHSFFILMANYTFKKIYIHILLFYYYATGHEYIVFIYNN